MKKKIRLVFDATREEATLIRRACDAEQRTIANFCRKAAIEVASKYKKKPSFSM